MFSYFFGPKLTYETLNIQQKLEDYSILLNNQAVNSVYYFQPHL